MKDYESLSKLHFDKQAPDYDRRNTAYYSKYPKISCRDAAQRLKVVPYTRLLDVGCGTGFLIELLKEQRKEQQEQNVQGLPKSRKKQEKSEDQKERNGRKEAVYCGLDLSSEMLKVAETKFDDSVSFKEGSADALPYEDESFDVVTCIQSFHHYPYPQKAMKEAFRVLKPGGIYLLSDTGCSGIVKWLENHLFIRLVNSGDFAVYNIQDIRRLMAGSGFHIMQAEKLTKFIYTVIGRKPV